MESIAIWVVCLLLLVVIVLLHRLATLVERSNKLLLESAVMILSEARELNSSADWLKKRRLSRRYNLSN